MEASVEDIGFFLDELHWGASEEMDRRASATTGSDSSKSDTSSSSSEGRVGGQVRERLNNRGTAGEFRDVDKLRRLLGEPSWLCVVGDCTSPEECRKAPVLSWRCRSRPDATMMERRTEVLLVEEEERVQRVKV